MTELWVVCHGETAWNRARRLQGGVPVPLNAKGRTQAAALAADLRPAGVTVIHASDLPRALQPAASRRWGSASRRRFSARARASAAWVPFRA